MGVDKLKILFLCTGNSCRSQMAEGWARALKGETIDAYSAGLETHGLNPHAVKVMAEAGVDISGQRSKLLDDLRDVDFDVVVTVCGHAHETCPMFPGGAKVVHVGFDDPPNLAKSAANETEALDCYRRVRDEIRAFVQTLPESLADSISMTDSLANDQIRQVVRKRYADIAREAGRCCASDDCCPPDALGNADASAKLGYSEEDLAAVPDGANMGLGCGNPRAIAALKPGETVLDLGSGGGFDCFLAARQVGETGRVIGVDMTPDMVGKARANAGKSGYDTVEFRLGEIEHLPVADASVDVIVSNCVINLSPDKLQVFREAFRVLRSGGRLAISDVVGVKPMPTAVKNNLDAHCACVAGAAMVDDVERMLADAGFEEIVVRVKEDSRDFIKDWIPGGELEECVRSAEIEARKR